MISVALERENPLHVRVYDRSAYQGNRQVAHIRVNRGHRLYKTIVEGASFASRGNMPPKRDRHHHVASVMVVKIASDAEMDDAPYLVEPFLN